MAVAMTFKVAWRITHDVLSVPADEHVGMTSATQGVALGGNPALHAIWMTTDGGQTWTVRPIQS